MDEPVQTGGGWGERTPADVSSLLVELSRVSKAAAFYGADARDTRTLAARTCRAWKADLARAGPLELEVIEGGFALSGAPGLFGNEHFGEAAAQLLRLGVQRIRFTEVLTPESVTAFVAEVHRLEEGNRPRSHLGIEVDGEICLSLDGDDAESTTQEMALTAEPPQASLGSSLLGGSPRVESSGETGGDETSGEEPSREDEKPESEGDPLGEPGGHLESIRLFRDLQELERCTDDDQYAEIAEKVASSARALCDEGLALEATRAMHLLADQAVGEGGRSAVQSRVARATLLELAIGERLGELIDRACGNDSQASVRAAQVLLVVGDQAVPALLERLESEGTGPRTGQLTGLIIALGECAVPSVMAAIASGAGSRARLGIRIAGDLQCPELVKPLRDLLCAKDGPLQRDAARALVEMGNAFAVRALLEALESKYDRIAEIATYSLGQLGAPKSLPALVRRLERATEERSWDLAREILLSIGQVHEGDRGTARALVAWVQRGGPPWRRPDLSLKLEAVAALGQLGGEDSTAALREIAGLRLSSRICERARRVLARRGDEEAPRG